MRRLLIMLSVTGCGRLAFDPVPAASDASDTDTGPQTYRDVVVADGPASYWRLADTGPTMRDEMGQVDGTYSGTCQRGVVGALVGDPDPAVAFDGSTCQVALGDHFDFPGAFSLEAWVSRAAGGQDYQHVFTRQLRNSGPTDGYALAVGTMSNPGAFAERVHGADNHNTAHIVFAPDAFHHLVAVFDTTALALYVDGVLATAIPDARDLPAFAAAAVIGNAPDGGTVITAFFHGTLDEVAVYDFALSAAQIEHHHAVGTTSP